MSHHILRNLLKTVSNISIHFASQAYPSCWLGNDEEFGSLDFVIQHQDACVEVKRVKDKRGPYR
jgi:hypothetical protein